MTGSCPPDHDPDDLRTRLDALRLENQRLHLALNQRALDGRRPVSLLRQAAGVALWHARRELHQATATLGRALGLAANDEWRNTAPWQVVLRHPPNSARPRVLHFIANFVTGGSSRLVVDLVEHLGHRFDQSIVTARLPNPPHYTGLAIQERVRFDSQRDALELLEQQQPRIIHVHNVADPDSPYSVDDWRWYHQLFQAIELHRRSHECRVIQNINIPVPPYISSGVDCYIYVSEYVRRTHGLHRAPGLTIYPGSDLERFRRESRDIPENTLGMVYRLERDKLDERSIEPFILAVGRRPGTRALIVGGGHYLEPYRRAVEHAGLTEAFTFTGYVAYDDLPSLFRQMTLFVAPVHTEGFGQVSPFAMAMRLPIAGYAVGALPEITGDPSVLAAPGDAAGLADVLVRLLDDRARREVMGEANRLRALERFSVEAMACAYDALYAELIGGTRALAP